jgi:probable rRNA maturation factor
MSIQIIHVARKVPTHPYDAIKEAILGKQYELTLSFIGERRALAINKAHRNATYIPNVLSFPLDMEHGEIYITPKVAEREAHKYNMTVDGYIGYLFIHGLLHLKGLDHGATMEKAEQKYVRKFQLR